MRILGARGSVPVSGREFMLFGGATTSILVNLSGNYLVVDAGSGFCKIPKKIENINKLDLFLTHLHLDHLIGLPLCPFLFCPDNSLTIHVPEIFGSDAESSIRNLFDSPYWPVTLEELPAEITFQSVKEKALINKICVETIYGEHPGGVVLYKISSSEKTVVIATDFTLTDTMVPELKEFADHCDLLLIDGQYSDQEWMNKCDYGHNKWTAAAAFGEMVCAEQVRIIHHDPEHTDERLIRAEYEVKEIDPACTFAKENELIIL